MKFRTTSFRIEIFNAQNKRPTLFARAFLRPPESQGVTEMQITCR
jgi:hypothetical protein